MLRQGWYSIEKVINERGEELVEFIKSCCYYFLYNIEYVLEFVDTILPHCS